MESRGGATGFFGWIPEGIRLSLSLGIAQGSSSSLRDEFWIVFFLSFPSRYGSMDSSFLGCRTAELRPLIAEETVAGARTRSGARRSGPGRERASAGLAMAGAGNGRRRAEAAGTVPAGTVRKEGRRKTHCGCGPGLEF